MAEIELKTLVIMMFAIAGVCLMILAMGASGVAWESAEWTEIGQNVGYFFVILGGISMLVWILREAWR